MRSDTPTPLRSPVLPARDIPLDAPPPGTRVLVAMSGGVDSSVAAALLKDAGCDVIGMFMRLGSPGESIDETPARDGAPGACAPNRSHAPSPRTVRLGVRGCCSVGDAADARAVASVLGIPFYVANFRAEFARVMDYFADEYARGRTPNPCVRCNDWLKFGRLVDHARDLGATHVASGHYARVDRSTPSPRLARAVDPAKDQSYVLFGIPRHHLASTHFPIGHLAKPRVRELAHALGLPVFDKPDSQDICFVPDGDYAGVVQRRRPDLARRGRVVDPSGAPLGEHDGHHNFTIGQRRGVALALGQRAYVVAKDPESNTVTLGPRDLLAADWCVAGEANWLADPPAPGRWVAAHAKFRSNSPTAPARVRADAPAPSRAPGTSRTGSFTVSFHHAQDAVAPGQAIVLYDDDGVVLGGGWIDRAGRGDAPSPSAREP